MQHDMVNHSFLACDSGLRIRRTILPVNCVGDAVRHVSHPHLKM